MKADSAIKVVAKEKNLGYVFDTSKNALLFAEESGDISTFVKMKLGIDPNAKPQGME
jgi:outer membrane protein